MGNRQTMMVQTETAASMHGMTLGGLLCLAHTAEGSPVLTLYEQTFDNWCHEISCREHTGTQQMLLARLASPACITLV